MRRPQTLISAIEPKLYGERFISFMINEVFISGDLIESQRQQIIDFDALYKNFQASQSSL